MKLQIELATRRACGEESSPRNLTGFRIEQRQLLDFAMPRATSLQ
jgi:hypothetical protein